MLPTGALKLQVVLYWPDMGICGDSLQIKKNLMFWMLTALAQRISTQQKQLA